MKSPAIVAGIAVLGLSLAGCAQVLKVRDFLADPKTQEASQVVARWGQAFACAVANATAVAGQIEDAVKADKAAIDTTGKILTVSTIVCGQLGGTVTGRIVAQ